MSFIGDSEREVIACIDKLQTSYNALHRAIVTDVKSKFIDVIGKNWYTPEAVKYFQNYFKVNFESLMKSINDTFVSAVNIINRAADDYAKDGGYTHVFKEIETKAVTCNVDSIKEIAGNGRQGIDPVRCRDAVSTLTSTIKKSCDDAITKAVNASQNNGFCEDKEKRELYNSFGKIKTSVNNAFKEVSEEAKKTITATAERYEKRSSQHKSSFSIK